MRLESKIMFRKFVQWGLAALIFVEIVSGYGISQYRAVEWMTFGLLSKARSFELHSFLAIPVIVFVVLHIYFSLNIRLGWGKND